MRKKFNKAAKCIYCLKKVRKNHNKKRCAEKKWKEKDL